MNVRYRVELSQAERDELKAMLGGGKHAARKLKRAQILLAADGGRRDEEIVRTVSVSLSTVSRTKRRFVEGNLERALSEEPRPGAERKLTGKEEALLVATAAAYVGVVALRHGPPPCGFRTKFLLIFVFRFEKAPGVSPRAKYEMLRLIVRHPAKKLLARTRLHPPRFSHFHSRAGPSTLTDRALGGAGMVVQCHQHPKGGGGRPEGSPRVGRQSN